MAQRAARMNAHKRQSVPVRSMQAWLRDALSGVAQPTTVNEIAQLTAKWSISKREHLAIECARSLLSEAAHDENVRILLAKGIVALLPDSMTQVEQLLNSKSREAAEAQFSLFAFLDDAAPRLKRAEDRKKVLRLVLDYLLGAKHNVAWAPWMAGDLLGDHWPFDESTPLLMEAAKHGRFVAGREAALHGISQALERVPKQLQWELVGTLKTVAVTDRSARLRRYAQALLTDLRRV